MVPPHLQRPPLVWAGPFILTCFLAGCGGSGAEARTALETRLQELQHENQGLRARLAEAKEGPAPAESCTPVEAPEEGAHEAGGDGAEPAGDTSPPERPELEIVKLVPGEAAPGAAQEGRLSDEPVSASALESAQAEAREEDGAPRPLLRLRGSEEPKLQPLDNAATKFGQADSPRTQP